MTTSSLLALALALPASAAPDARALLESALTPPATAYAAETKILVYPRPKPGAAKARPLSQARSVRWSPPDSRRLEMHRRRGGPAVFFDLEEGGTRVASWPEKGAGWRFPSRPLAPAARAALLLSRYELAVSTGGRPLKRAADRLEFRDRGVLRAAWWVDRETGLVLRREDYRPDGSLQRRERLLSLAWGSAPSPAAFPLPAKPGGLDDPYFKEHEGLPAASSAAFAARHPGWLPPGCVPFVAVASRDLKAVHVSYNDGAKAVTVSQGALKAPAGEPYARVRLGSVPASLHEVPEGLSVAFRAGGRDFQVTGDLPEADLLAVALTLAEAR